MKAKEFFYKVAEMRNAQKEYFKTRSFSCLQASKKLEKEIDEEIKRVLELTKEKTLFE